MKEPTLHDVLTAIGSVATTQAQHRQALTELAHDLKGVRATLDEHTATLDAHTATLDAHTATLDSHSRTLAEHSAILADHSAVLAEHSVVLAEHSAVLAEHTQALAGHSRAFERVERRQRAETSRLDRHEARIKHVESRR